jgi:DNA-binding transcriptional MerR regulator
MYQRLSLKRKYRNSGRKPQARIEATTYIWARELGVSIATLRMRLRQLDIDLEAGQKFGARIIYQAMTGGLQQARAREANARAEVAELEAAKMREDLKPVADLLASLRNTLLPIRQRLLALPSEAAHNCNPADPEHARRALQDWLDISLAIIQTEQSKLMGGTASTQSDDNV